MLNDFNILDMKKTRMNYFANDLGDIREKGIAMFGIETNQKKLESDKASFEIAEDYLIFLQFRIDFDLIYFDSEDDSLQNKKPKDIQDDEVSARLNFRFEGILTINEDVYKEDKDFSDLFHKEITRFADPYIRKEIREFTSELELPMFPLPYNIFTQIRE